MELSGSLGDFRVPWMTLGSSSNWEVSWSLRELWGPLKGFLGGPHATFGVTRELKGFLDDF